MSISSVVRCLFRSFAHFQSYCSFSSCRVLRVSWCVLGNSPLQTCPLQIFSPRLWLVISLSQQCLSQPEVFNYNEFQLIYFLSWIVHLVLYQNCHHHTQSHPDILRFYFQGELLGVNSAHFMDCYMASETFQSLFPTSLPSYLFSNTPFHLRENQISITPNSSVFRITDIKGDCLASFLKFTF